MTCKELAAVKYFAVSTEIDDGISAVSISYAERALLRCSNGDSSALCKYSDLRFLLPTSNILELWFLKAGYLINHRRRCITPANFEPQVLLNDRNNFWDVLNFNQLMVNCISDQ